MPNLSEIAAALDLSMQEHGARTIRGVAGVLEANDDEIAFIASDAFAAQYRSTRAGAIVVSRKVKLPVRPGPPPVLVVDDADLAMATVLGLFAPPVPRPDAGIDPAAHVAPSALVGEGCRIGPLVVVGKRSRIGRNTVLHPGVVIGDEVTIGEDCELFANVVVRERITIGHRVIIHAGSVLGSDGFGYRWDGQQHRKIPQIGTVVIEDDVEIGSCVCVDRAKFAVTRIGRGTKIDNLVQVAHNVQIGEHCIIVGQVGLAGSVKLGKNVVLGGQSAVRDHITVGDNAMAAATAGIIEDVPPNAVVSGTPAFPHRQSLREQAAFRRLPDLVVQVRKLQEEIAALKKDRT
jgi:UDP-3-O-[3-hydroxymyristoyl] glucosamine N-acyltransferase